MVAPKRSVLPPNAVAYALYRLGNPITSALGVDPSDPVRLPDFNISNIGKEEKDVLRTAVENARKDGRSFIKYEDYPPLADGMSPATHRKSGRLKKESSAVMLRRSLADPVYAMYTLLGVFNFKNTNDGGFTVNDKYDFDASKTKKGYKPTDDFGKAVVKGQDITKNETLSFNVSGSISGNQETKKMAISTDHFKLLAQQVAISLAERVGVDLGQAMTITANQFTDSTLNVIRDVAIKNARAGRYSNTYNDYRVGSNDILSARNQAGMGTFQQLAQIATSLSPEQAAKTSLGKSDTYIDDRGHLIIVDSYNFHEADTSGSKRVVDRVERMFMPSGIFGVSKKNDREVYIDLGPAPADLVQPMRTAGRIVAPQKDSEDFIREEHKDAVNKTGSNYFARFFDAIENELSTDAIAEEQITTEKFSPEALGTIKHALDKYFTANPDAVEVETSSNFLGFESDTIMNHVVAKRTNDGGYQLKDASDPSQNNNILVAGRRYAQGLAEQVDQAITSSTDWFASQFQNDSINIDIKIPPVMEAVSDAMDDFFGIEETAAVPKFLTNPLTKSRLDKMNAVLEATPLPEVERPNNLDVLGFGEAFARSRSAGQSTFTWRGNDYTTRYKDEQESLDGEDTSMATQGGQEPEGGIERSGSQVVQTGDTQTAS